MADKWQSLEFIKPGVGDEDSLFLFVLAINSVALVKSVLDKI